MNVNFINPVLTSILNVLSTMAHIEPKVGTPKKKDKNEIVHGRNITGVMSMVGRKGNASIALTFSEAAICHIASEMFHSEITAMTVWLSIWLVSLPIWFSAAQKANWKKKVIFSNCRCRQ